MGIKRREYDDRALFLDGLGLGLIPALTVLAGEHQITALIFRRVRQLHYKTEFALGLIQSYGREGQPIDVFYPPGEEVVVLPELFNKSYLLDRLAKELEQS